MSPPEVLVHHDADLLAKAIAARLVTRLVDAQAAAGTASLVLTGGGIGTAVLAELAAAPARDAVDWHRLDIWWGDERFLPSGDPERNEAGAEQALLRYLDMDPRRVHRMPGTDGPDGPDPEAAAARYADWLREAAQPEDHGPDSNPVLHLSPCSVEVAATLPPRALAPRSLPTPAIPPLTLAKRWLFSQAQSSSSPVPVRPRRRPPRSGP